MSTRFVELGALSNFLNIDEHKYPVYMFTCSQQFHLNVTDWNKEILDVVGFQCIECGAHNKN